MIQVTFKQTIFRKSSNSEDFLLSLIEAFKAMDIFALENLLDDDIILGKDSKWDFLSYVRDRFKILRDRGNTFLELRMEKCQRCCYHCDAHFFHGNKTRGWIALVIKMEGNELTDITICNAPTGVVEYNMQYPPYIQP